MKTNGFELPGWTGLLGALACIELAAAPSVTRFDDTPINRHDDRVVGLTADNQGTAPGDIVITRRIREALMKDGTLSTYAQNVKIITNSGLVTLKGPVKTLDEKYEVEKKAIFVAGFQSVTSRIAVAP